MNFGSTFVWTTASTAVRLGFGLLVGKVAAIFLGPSGLVLMSQIQNFVQLLSTPVAGGISNGLTALTARRSEDEESLKLLWSTSIAFILLFSILSILICFVFKEDISVLIFNDIQYSSVIFLAALTLPLTGISSLIIAVLFGFRDPKGAAIVTMVGTGCAALFTASLAFYFGLIGGLIAAATYQAITLVGAVAIIRRNSWLSIGNFTSGFDKASARALADFGIMALVSGVAISLTQLVVRQAYIETFGQHQAGLWDAINRLSSIHWSVVSAAMAGYFLPLLPGALAAGTWKDLMKKNMSIVMPFFLISCTGLYIFANFLLEVLFSSEFSIGSELLPFQLMGDMFRVFTWYLAYILIANRNITLYCVLEVSSNGVFLLTTMFLMDEAGLQAAPIGHLVAFGSLALYTAFALHRKGLWQDTGLMKVFSRPEDI